jgi:hypothetical protein
MATPSNLVVNFAAWHVDDKFPVPSIRQGTERCSIRALLGSRIYRAEGIDDALYPATPHASTARAIRREETQEGDEWKVVEGGDRWG